MFPQNIRYPIEAGENRQENSNLISTMQRPRNDGESSPKRGFYDQPTMTLPRRRSALEIPAFVCVNFL